MALVAYAAIRVLIVYSFPTGTAVLLQEGPANPATQKGALEVATRQARHMKQMLDALLDLARINEGRITLQRTRVDLGTEIHLGGQGKTGHLSTLQNRPSPVSGIESTPIAASIAAALGTAAVFSVSAGELRTAQQPIEGQYIVVMKDDVAALASEVGIAARGRRCG